MTQRVKFIFGTIIGVMIGLIMGWLLSGLLTASLFLFLFSDLPEPWTNIQEKIAIGVVIISWTLIVLGGLVGGWLGWRRSRGEPVKLLNELKLKNLLPIIIALVVGGGTVLIVGWWIWGNLPLPKKLHKTIEGVFYPVPTDPTALVVGFRTCDGLEYYVHPRFDTADFSYLKDGSLIKGTFRLINPTIGGGLIKMHGYEPLTTKKVNNLIKDVDQVIFISDSECTPSTGFLEKVVITTDKTEYTQGEEITARLSYYTRIYTWQGYSWSIQRMENNSWVTILRRGDPFFFCSNIPECKNINLNKVEECPSIALCEREMWYEVKDTPELTWDQSYKVEEKTFQCRFVQRLPGGKIVSEEIENRTCAIFEQVPPGRYRILFEYASTIDQNDPFNRNIDFKYAEKIFIIKQKEENPQETCLETCRCMKECNKEGPLYFIHTEEGFSECSVNLINKTCCCSGV